MKYNFSNFKIVASGDIELRAAEMFAEDTPAAKAKKLSKIDLDVLADDFE